MSGIGSAVEVCVDFASCGDETFGDGGAHGSSGDDGDGEHGG